ncbi:MAG: DUF5680 domain-containing protein [Candidatus Paceibacterota bacterium]|jgi:hypothetical protein
MSQTPAYKITDHLPELEAFLDEANKSGYATGESPAWVKEADGSTTIAHESKDGLWRYHDNFFGGEPYGGREVVFREGKAVWMMVYYGAITGDRLDKNKVYAFLRQALAQADPALPVRGPKFLPEKIDGHDWVYETSWSGDLTGFLGRESIKLDGQEIYYANYSGGPVDVTGEV